MSIQNCLARLVQANRISQKAADDALALHEGIQARLYPSMGPASADAAGALEAARVMMQAAQERKLMAAKQAIRQSEIANRMELHPKGKSTGLMSALVRDNWEGGAATKDAINIESHAESVTKKLLGIMNGTMDKYRSTMAGLRQDTESIWNVVDEVYGVDSGDADAKAAAQAFSATAKYAVDRVKREGKPLSVLEDWRLPQSWDAKQVKNIGERTFINDLMTEYEGGNLKVMDKAGHGEAPKAAVPGIIANAFNDITIGKGQGSGAGGFSNQLRVFRFENPDTYKRLMQKYGVGSGGLFNTMMGHVQAMAKEIAFVEVLGPNYQQTFDKLLQVARDDFAQKGKAGKLVDWTTMNNPVSVQRSFDALSGRLGAAQSDLIAGIGGGMRNLMTASRLGSATISALPGDSMTAILASNYNNVPAAAVLSRLVTDLTTNRQGAEELARQLNLTAATVLDTAIGTKRFDDEVIGQGVTGRLADGLMRITGINTWTEGLKRAFSMEFMGMIARQTEHKFEDLDPVFRGFLDRYGFNAGDWDKLRVSPHIEAEGAKFFDVNGVEDQRLADRLMSAIIDERHFAVVEPDARIRGKMALGMQRGTILGEAVRSATQFKSFPMTYMMTHLMRALTQGSMSNRAYRTTQLLLTMTMAGAATMQAQSLIAGRDPNDMSKPNFWTEAFIRGGGGMLGDFVNSSVTRGGDGITQYLTGPGPGEVISATGDVAQWIANKKDVNGKTFAQHVKAWTPGSSLWYTKAATDRLIFDNIQAMIDPNYRQSFNRYERRMKKDFGQTFWWAPGDGLPQRAPEIRKIWPR
ncbi:hypothetical protein J3P71_17730 [Rhizobium leguminosarum]|uniref:hypothetical protein n=1 Tax=Rhizobium leguminosarum TaxID=384 RepID=UPI0014419F1F|nr:hypothetical protein [Rhizobium leguminosarum]MBY5838072.1 hypothetical protein [Rhizobium leguminosarum]NKM82239.1 hypothetical protein [Rhizobium leguminosarum bv. viciae]QSZ06709.1 hypothetical protein J3P71_17730 [Rhizobium leguminosarum]